MNKTKWTPGSWEKNDVGMVISGRSDKRYIICQPHLYVDVPMHSPEMNASVDLISAAPDLYTAHVLRNALEDLNFSGSPEAEQILRDHGWYPALCSQTRFVENYTARAMEKARGE